MYTYDKEKLVEKLDNILAKEIPEAGWTWLKEKSGLIAGENGIRALFSTFMTLPRHTGKSALAISPADQQEIDEIRNGFSVTHFKADQLARIWVLLQLPAEDKARYLKAINQLFQTAEMNELVAMYSALPVLAYPTDWVDRCAEGIRSNIGTVLEAIMYENPYPAEHLNEPAWNQMVLKAFFTDKQVQRITGLDQRANRQLAYMLSDYAHERWSAHRPVNPQLWRLVGKFLDERTFPDIKRLCEQDDDTGKQTAALVCAETSYAPAKALLQEMPSFKDAILNNRLNWETESESKKNILI